MSAPLEGVRVVEMGQLIAIPWAIKMLADMGAQVIRLESCQRLESYRGDSVYQNDVSGEFWNRGANFYEQNRNKLGITLDLSQSEGLGILYLLLRWNQKWFTCHIEHRFNRPIHRQHHMLPPISQRHLPKFGRQSVPQPGDRTQMR